MQRPIVTRPFGQTADGTPVELFVLSNGGIELHTITLGAIITSLRVPDRSGRAADVVLGHESAAGYHDNRPYLGAVVGRYANRIAGGRFELDGVTYQLSRNEGPNHLHGGHVGFDRRVWQATPATVGGDPAVSFSLTSPAGEEGYPGTLHAIVTYVLRADGSFAIDYEASTDAPTIVNLTQHTYFNLGGESSTSVLDHQLAIYASRYTPVDDALIPTGEIAPVDGTALDFRRGVRLDTRLGAADEQLRVAGGLDHNFVLTRKSAGLEPAAVLYHAGSGRRLEVWTTEPGLQVYAGHLLDWRAGAYGRLLAPHAGMCLETQHFPDSPNQPRFPSVTLRPGARYRSTTHWRFSTRA